MARTAFPNWLAEEAPLAPSERRRGLRRPPVVTSGGVRIEALAFDVMSLHRRGWRDLAARAVEPNVFLDPDFALAAARHLPAARRPLFLVARAPLEGRMTMIGLLALDSGQPDFTGAVRGWSHDYSALGVPLLDARRAQDALEGLLQWIASEMPRAGALLLNNLPQDGAVAQLLRRMAQTQGRQFRVIATRQRAALRCGDGANAAVNGKEARRQWRRLGEAGRLETRVLSGPAELRDGLETFLALEALGWKGERGTALVSHPGSASFARAALRLMAQEGAARIVSIEIDGAPIAMGVALVSGARAAFWKIAHDPAFARYSPGVQLTLRLSEWAAAQEAIELVDSCAIEDHPMIDRLWPERLSLVDALIALPREGAARSGAFQTSLAGETLRRNARGVAKRAFLAATGRKRS